jgi:rod shape-determining protein MreD
MKLTIENKGKQASPTITYIYYLVTGLILSVIQVALLDFISIDGVTPDLLLIFCVWVTLKEGKFTGLFAGFLTGLIFDVVSMDVVGTNALAKTAACLIAGWFYRENKTNQIVGSFLFLLIILLCSLLHNLIYFFFYLKASDISYFGFFAKYGLATSLYTTVIAVFVMFYKMKKKK